jgi:hypothetical protein
MRGLSACAALAVALATGACEDTSYRDIGAEISLLTKRDDAFVPPAIKRLAAYGKRAIPQIETALHTASVSGKRHLFAALSETGDPESVPVLRHFALYDSIPELRALCEAKLQVWASERGARGDAARSAVAWLTDRRGRGEGPVVAAGGPK